MVQFPWTGKYQKEILRARRKLENDFEVWRKPALQLQQLLRTIASKLVRTRKDVNIARLTGSGLSLGLGVPLMVAGTVLIPFTLGVSTPLVIAGTAVSAAGGMAAGGATLVEHFIRTNYYKQIQQLQDMLRDSSPKLFSSILKLKEVLLESFRRGSFLQPDAQSELCPCPDVKTAVDGALVAGKVAGAGLRFAANYSDDAFRWLGTCGSVSGPLGTTAARIALGSIFTGLAAVVDIWTIVDSALNLSQKGNRYAAVAELERRAEQIEKTLNETTRLLQQTAGVARGDQPSIFNVAEDTKVCFVCLEASGNLVLRCLDCRTPIACDRCFLVICTDAIECPKCPGRDKDIELSFDEMLGKLNHLQFQRQLSPL